MSNCLLHSVETHPAQGPPSPSLSHPKRAASLTIADWSTLTPPILGRRHLDQAPEVHRPILYAAWPLRDQRRSASGKSFNTPPPGTPFPPPTPNSGIGIKENQGITYCTMPAVNELITFNSPKSPETNYSTEPHLQIPRKATNLSCFYFYLKIKRF